MDLAEGDTVMCSLLPAISKAFCFPPASLRPYIWAGEADWTEWIMPKLTKRVVDGLKPRTATEAFVWDSEVKGLGIRIKPSGTRSYLIQYRNQARRTRRMVLGHCGVLSLEEARGLAREKLVEVIKGEDPSAAHKNSPQIQNCRRSLPLVFGRSRVRKVAGPEETPDQGLVAEDGSQQH